MNGYDPLDAYDDEELGRLAEAVEQLSPEERAQLATSDDAVLAVLREAELVHDGRPAAEVVRIVARTTPLDEQELETLFAGQDGLVDEVTASVMARIRASAPTAVESVVRRLVERVSTALDDLARNVVAVPTFAMRSGTEPLLVVGRVRAASAADAVVDIEFDDVNELRSLGPEAHAELRGDGSTVVIVVHGADVPPGWTLFVGARLPGSPDATVAVADLGPEGEMAATLPWTEPSLPHAVAFAMLDLRAR